MIKNKISIALALVMPFASYAAESIHSTPEVLKVTSSADDGSAGTLRWALEKNNQNAGHYRIEIQSPDNQPLVIKPVKPLPEILGPVDIINLDWLKTGKFAAIDGSGYIRGTDPQSCPGAVSGQYGFAP